MQMEIYIYTSGKLYTKIINGFDIKAAAPISLFQIFGYQD